MKDFLLKNKDFFKFAAAGFVTALFVLGASIVFSNLLYQPKELVKRGYKPEINPENSQVGGVLKFGVDSGGSEAAAAQEIDIEAMVASANVKAGEKIFKKCKTCHVVQKDGANKIGPNLYDIIGRKKASVANFAYSDALKNIGGVWDIAEISKFITKPSQYASGTKMAFVGLKKAKDRANVIAYLKAQSQ